MTILASDFSGMAPLVLAVPVVLLMAVASFVPSSRGHWSGPALTAPLLLLGVAFILVQSDFHDLEPMMWSMLLAPVAIGGASIIVWAVRRRGGAR